MRRVERPSHDDAVTALWDAIKTAAGQPNRLWADGTDTDAGTHRDAYYSVFADAGIEADLADSLYAVESDPTYNCFAVDAAPTIRRLAAGGYRIGVISDIHFALRPVFRAADLFEPIDSFILSFEQGVQKPDPAIFRVALDALGTQPEETLMVGDRPSHDGPAVDLGIPTVLLPTLASIQQTRLGIVEAIVSASNG
jgi:FMN phosphatase YigB (HAD superfamily)